MVLEFKDIIFLNNYNSSSDTNNSNPSSGKTRNFHLYTPSGDLVDEVYDEESGAILCNFGQNGDVNVGEIYMEIVIPENINIPPCSQWTLGNGSDVFYIANANNQNTTTNHTVLNIYVDTVDSDEPQMAGRVWYGSNSCRAGDSVNGAWTDAQGHPLCYSLGDLSKPLTILTTNGSRVGNITVGNSLASNIATRLSKIRLFFTPVFTATGGWAPAPNPATKELGSYYTNTLGTQSIKSLKIYSEEYPNGIETMWS